MSDKSQFVYRSTNCCYSQLIWKTGSQSLGILLNEHDNSSLWMLSKSQTFFNYQNVAQSQSPGEVAIFTTGHRSFSWQSTGKQF